MNLPLLAEFADHVLIGDVEVVGKRQRGSTTIASQLKLTLPLWMQAD